MFSTRPTIIPAISTLTRQAMFRPLHTSQTAMATIEVGDVLPDAELFEDYPTNKIKMSDLTAGKRLVMFGVPGAFTPACSKHHLAGFVKNSEEIKKSGIDEIVCIAVNDPFVMSAWGTQHQTKGKVRMLADPSGAFIKTLDLGMNLAALGGFRAKRFSMVISRGTVEELHVEPDGTGLTCSLAENLKYKGEVQSEVQK